MDDIRAFMAVQEAIQMQSGYARCAVRKSWRGLQFEVQIWFGSCEEEPDVVVSRWEGEPRWRVTWHDDDAEIRCAIEDLPAFAQDVRRYGIDAAVDAWGPARDESADQVPLVST